ncbi:hypothetical protein [Paenibacillus sp. B1-33]|uniref:hypothetical protein n=1 Tax=unclassified Paenibacillus TaxID=185978 RepID=UPI003D2B0E94
MVQHTSFITILTSGNSLGAYVPGIRLVEKLCQRGIPAEAEVLERLFPEEVRRNMIRTKQLFHSSFGAAKMGTKLARDIGLVLDDNAVRKLLQRWKAEGRSTFLAVTGFWIPIMKQYELLMHPEPIRIEFLRLDAVDTPSYRPYFNQDNRFRDHWLFQLEGEATTLHARLVMSDEALIPYLERERRIVVHGGGWGIGTYRSTIAALQQHYPLAFVAYDVGEAQEALPNDRVYMTDPEWHPWLDETLPDGQFPYPPTAEWKRNEPLIYERSANGPRLYAIIRSSMAIVSKPGGGTLIDSLSAATPLIYLEPFGEHERANAELWERLGFGISYERWSQAGFSWELLHELHHNLKSNALSLSDFGGMYA